MKNILSNLTSADEVALVTPSSTAQYPLGTVITIRETATDSTETASKAVKKYMYVKSHTTLTAYKPYTIGFSATAGAEIITAAPTTFTGGAGLLVCVPQVAFTSGYYGFVQIEGDCSVLMTAETYASGDYLQVINSGVAAIVDGTSGATVLTSASMAICKASGTTAVARAAYLLGAKAVIASV